MNSEEHGINKKEEIVRMMRGFVATPILCQLHELNLVDVLSKPFNLHKTAASFSLEQGSFHAVVEYLEGVGLLERCLSCDPDQIDYTPSLIGSTVFKRFSSFTLLYSYDEMFRSIEGLLTGSGGTVTPNRRRNIEGSGLTHTKKYFPAAIEMLTAHDYKGMIDLGCGNGTFINKAVSDLKLSWAVGVDLSFAATDSISTSDIRENRSNLNVIRANAFEIDSWRGQIQNNTGKIFLSLWFLLHEMRGGNIASAVEFLRRLKDTFDGPDFIIGELIKIESATISESNQVSILPEFKLFHALSGQTLFARKDLEEIFRRVPLQIKNVKEFDQVGNRNEASICVWHLTSH